MTLPSGQISMSQVNTELGRPASQQLSMNDSGLRGLAGVSSGQISMSQLLGKSAITFTPAPGTYQYDGGRSVAAVISASTQVVWTYTRSGAAAAQATPASGSSSSTWNASMSNPTITARSTLFDVTATVAGRSFTWRIILNADGTGSA